LIDRPQDLCQEPLYERLGQPVEDKGAFLVALYHASLSQHPQLLGDVYLGPPQSGLEMTHTRLTPTQLVQDTQTRPVRKYVEQFRCVLI
jgi:hypothetical protein